jgi:putative transposase
MPRFTSGRLNLVGFRLQVSDVRRLKDLEDENGKLKKLLAEQMLDNAGLKGLLAKNF